jgi:hypothetical protein
MSDQQWHEILALLPDTISQQARTHKAFLRSTGMRCPTDLLRGILAYVFCLGSFRQVGSWASSIGLCANGARSWAKRTRQAATWLLWIVSALLMPVPVCPEEEVKTPLAFTGRIHLVDATHLRTWKRTGESRRLHCSYDLLGQRLEQVLLTDQHVGEGLRHFQWQPGDIVVADSAYCRRQAIIDQVEAGVDVVVRLHWSSTPLQQADGTSFDLAGWLKQRQSQGQGEEEVFIQVRTHRVRLRLLALRLSEAAAKRAQQKRKASARTHGCTNQALTIQLADWLVLLTSLEPQQWSRQQVLTLYRTRWQIELLFKRIKQLVRLHRLRSNVMQSNQAVLAAMLIGWILLEQQANQVRQDAQAQEAESQAAPISTWALCAILLQSLRTMILGSWTWSQIRATLGQTRRLITPEPQQRPQQGSACVDQLILILSTRPL